MKKMKILTVVGTRPEIIRLSQVIQKLELHTDHKLVHTGQNYDYELSEIFFKDLGLRKPDYFLDSAQGSAAQTIGQIIQKVGTGKIFAPHRYFSAKQISSGGFHTCAITQDDEVACWGSNEQQQLLNGWGFRLLQEI